MIFDVDLFTKKTGIKIGKEQELTNRGLAKIIPDGNSYRRGLVFSGI